VRGLNGYRALGMKGCRHVWRFVWCLWSCGLEVV
jgi:hypothetical protein